MPESQSTWRSWHYIALWVIALLSLVFNVALVAGFYAFRAQAQQEVSQVAAVLNDVELNELDFPVNINETLPISLTEAAAGDPLLGGVPDPGLDHRAGPHRRHRN